MAIDEYLQKAGEWFLTSGLQILLVVILMVIALKVGGMLSERLLGTVLKGSKEDMECKKRADTLSAILRNILNIVIFAVGLMIVLQELGIEVGPILAAAGVLGLAVGFGAQSLVKDVISGFFILLEDQVRVGDVVQILGKGGLVEKITLRMVILRDLAGNVHYIPNGQIDVVTNMTKGYSRYVFDIGVAYREDVDEVIKIIKEVDEGLRKDKDYKNDILEPIEILGLDKFADSAIVIKARTKTTPIQQWRVAREFNRRLKKRFDEENIEIPFPHVTLYMGQDKANNSPALNVNVTGKSK